MLYRLYNRKKVISYFFILYFLFVLIWNGNITFNFKLVVAIKIAYAFNDNKRFNVRLICFFYICHIYITIFRRLRNVSISVMRLLQLPHRAYTSKSSLHENRQSRYQGNRDRIHAIDQNDPSANNQLKYLITARSWWGMLQN